MTVETIRFPIIDGEPTQILRELRRRAPVVEVTLWNGRRAWLVTRYEVACRALTDPRLSTDATNPSYPSLNPNLVIPTYRGGMSRIDDARHREIRAMVTNKFTARAAQQLRPMAEQIVAEQLALLLRNGPPADLVATFAQPVPLRLMCHVLGVAEQDLDYVKHHAHMTVTRAPESSQPSVAELRAFADGMVRRSEASPGEDLVGQLAREQLLPGAIAHEELVDLVLILLVSGHTTTTSAIGLSVLSLLEEPDHYRALHDNPAMVDSMVEELLRFLMIALDGVAPRWARHGLALGDVTIRAGDAVLISVTSANRDEEVFADPDAIQPHRPNLHRHIAYGLGAHRCLGQHLARMELQVALAALTRAIPTLRLAVPLERLQFGQREKHQGGVKELPVTWE